MLLVSGFVPEKDLLNLVRWLPVIWLQILAINLMVNLKGFDKKKQ